MKTHTATYNPSWSTASFGLTATASQMDFFALGEHLNLCKAPHGRLFALHCAAERMQGFVATRFFTTLVVVALLTGAGSMVL